MSSATTKKSEIALNSQERLFDPNRCEVMEAVAQGLHQMAQPMTVLQGVLELGLIEPCSAEEYQRTLQRAMDQWQRVAASIDAIRQLVHVRACPHSVEDHPATARPQKSQPTIEATRRCTRV